MADDLFYATDEELDRDALGLDGAGDAIAGEDETPKDDKEDEAEATDEDADAAKDDKAEGDDGEDEEQSDAGDGDELSVEELQALAGEGSDSVPHARFHEVNEKAKLLAAENEELKRKLGSQAGGGDEPGAQADEQVFDFVAREKEYADALIDGDNERAAKIRSEIRAAERAELQEQMRHDLEQESAQREVVRLFQSETQKVLTDYPQLNDAGGDADAITDVVDLRDVYISRGDPAHVALRKAADKVALQNGWTKLKADEESEAQRTARQARQQEARQRAADASMRQPPQMRGGAGDRGKGEKLDLDNISQEQYEQLPQSERDQLLGNA